MKTYIIFIFGIIFFSCISFCAETVSNSVGNIKMDKMIYHSKKGYIELLENVVLKLDGTVLQANKAIVFMPQKDVKEKTNKNKKLKKANFSKIVATGNVRIEHPDGIAIGERAVWLKGKDTIKLSGNPGVESANGETIYADAIIYDLKTKRCSFVGRPHGRGKVKSSDRKKLF